MQTNINVQALTGKREHIYHAAELALDEIWSMVDDLVAAHGDFLPAFA
jgi:alpha-galactosidase